MMSKFYGEEMLKANNAESVVQGIQKITEKVYYIAGYGTSNAVLVISEKSCLLIDALSDSLAAETALKEIEKITNKPVGYLIYTHTHPDHIGGAGILAKDAGEIIAHTPMTKPYDKSIMLQQISQIRGNRQFGANLSDEEALSSGLGPIGPKGGKFMFLPPTRFIAEERLTLSIDGITVELIAAPGETDDQMYVYLPEEKVLCCGDNYYRCWPNLSAIRGSQYRDVAAWVDSLDVILAAGAEYLLPGHSQAINGTENIRTQIGAYREAINFVLEETLKGMNEGLTPDDLIEKIKLPEHLRDLPQLREFYGTIAWSIRGICGGYLGWFDGNPTNLGFMAKKERAQKQLALMGGAETVLKAAADALANEDEQWAAELCDILLNANVLLKEAKEIKSKSLVNLGRMATSANGRHYYLSCAKELLK